LGTTLIIIITCLESIQNLYIIYLMYNFIEYIYRNTKQRKTLSKLNSSLYSFIIVTKDY